MVGRENFVQLRYQRRRGMSGEPALQYFALFTGSVSLSFGLGFLAWEMFLIIIVVIIYLSPWLPFSLSISISLSYSLYFSPYYSTLFSLDFCFVLFCVLSPRGIFLLLCVVFSSFLLYFCVYVRLQIHCGSAFGPDTSGPPYYCASLVCVPKV